MRNSIQAFIGLLTLTGLAALSTHGHLAEAAPPHHEATRGNARQAGMPAAGLLRAIASLDLSEDQRTMLATLREDTKAQMQAMRESKQALRRELSQQVSSGEDIDGDSLHRILDEQAAIRLEFAHEFLDAVLEIESTLTDEQRSALHDKKSRAAVTEKRDRPAPTPAPQRRRRQQ